MKKLKKQLFANVRILEAYDRLDAIQKLQQGQAEFIDNHKLSDIVLPAEKLKYINTNVLKNKQNLKDALNYIFKLLDIAENYYPEYSSSDLIAEIDDFIKKFDK